MEEEEEEISGWPSEHAKDLTSRKRERVRRRDKEKLDLSRSFGGRRRRREKRAFDLEEDQEEATQVRKWSPSWVP